MPPICVSADLMRPDPTVGLVGGTFALWVGDPALLHPIETGGVDIKTLPEFEGSYTTQTDIEVPFTWGVDEPLDRFDCVYRGEIDLERQGAVVIDLPTQKALESTYPPVQSEEGRAALAAELTAGRSPSKELL